MTRLTRTFLSLFVLSFVLDAGAQAPTLRVMTYNIHHGEGTDERLDLERIAEVIRDQDPDVVGLQEVDRHWSERSRFVDQAGALASMLDMHLYFAPIYDLAPADAAPSDTSAQSSDNRTTLRRHYGLAVLSRYPILQARNVDMVRKSSIEANSSLTPMSGVPHVTIRAGGETIHILNTHLDYRPEPSLRHRQASDLMHYIRGLKGPIVLMGDFNAEPEAEEMKEIREWFVDVGDEAAGGSGGTYPADDPAKRIDMIFVSPGVEIQAAFVPETTASDHRPLVADLILSYDVLDWVDEQMRRLTAEEKVSQMFSTWVSGHYQSIDDPAYEEVVKLVEHFGVGGVIFGVGDPLSQAVLTNDLQRRARVPLLVAQDMEWGAGMRHVAATSFPPAMALGASRDTALAYAVGYATAQEARAIGVQQVLAPVADVNNNPANPVINIRSFGERPDLVARMASAFVRGVEDGGAFATVKHFPGHGDTAVDSHIGLPVLAFEKSRLDTLELVPFRAAVDAGVTSVMTGHLALPEIESNETVPATLSRRITTNILRRELGFRGLVVTDAMTMSGVSAQFSVGEAAVRAAEAGADMLLKSGDYYAARRAVLEAVRSGRISMTQIDASVRRILNTKARMGLHRREQVDLDSLRGIVASRRHTVLADLAARSCLTLLRNNGDLLPLGQASRPRLLVVTISDDDDPSEGRFLRVAMHRNRTGGSLGFSYLDARSDAQDFARVLDEARAHDVVVVGAFLRVRSGSGRIRLPEAQRRFLDELIASGPPVALVSFGNPYMAAALKTQPDVYLSAYGSAPSTQTAAAEALYGRSPTRGVLPVTIPDTYAYGEGIFLDQVAPRFDVPEAVEMDGVRLAEIDTMMHGLISRRAFPGAAVVVGRGDVVIVRETYGYATFAQDESIDMDTPFPVRQAPKVMDPFWNGHSISANDLVEIGFSILNEKSGVGTELLDDDIRDVFDREQGVSFWIDPKKRLFAGLLTVTADESRDSLRQSAGDRLVRIVYESLNTTPRRPGVFDSDMRKAAVGGH